jgi:excisionase family DNA binding protein
MIRTKLLPSVLTLPEAARYLRLRKDLVEKYAQQGLIPARQIGDEWRFLRAALDDWLRTPDSSWNELMKQVGAFSDDETLDEIRAAAYAARGRAEKERMR